MSVSAADCGASRERCRNEDVEVHEFSAESCTVCIRCGLMLGRHIDLLVSQVPLVQPILEGMAHLTVAGLRNQAIGALSLCKHALQAAVLTELGVQWSDDSFPDEAELLEFRGRVSAVLNALLAVEASIQLRIDSMKDDTSDSRGGASTAIIISNSTGATNARATISHEVIIIDD